MFIFFSRSSGRKNEGCLFALVQIFVVAGIIGLFLRYWPVALGALVLWFGATIVSIVAKDKAKARKEREADLATLKEETRRHVEQANIAKLMPTRLRHCAAAVSLLKKIRALDPHGNEDKDTNNLLSKMESLERTLPVLGLMNVAERAEFKGQGKRALDAHLDAAFHCKKQGVTDRDFAIAEIRHPETGQLVTLQDLWLKAGLRDGQDPGPALEQGSAATEHPLGPEVQCPDCLCRSTLSAYAADEGGRGHCPFCGTAVAFE